MLPPVPEEDFPSSTNCFPSFSHVERQGTQHVSFLCLTNRCKVEMESMTPIHDTAPLPSIQYTFHTHCITSVDRLVASPFSFPLSHSLSLFLSHFVIFLSHPFIYLEIVWFSYSCAIWFEDVLSLQMRDRALSCFLTVLY